MGLLWGWMTCFVQVEARANEVLATPVSVTELVLTAKWDVEIWVLKSDR